MVEERAEQFSQPADRNGWRLVGPMHIADTKEQAIADVEFGLGQWVDYFQRVAALPLAPETTDHASLVDALNASGFAVIGTVEDAIEQVKRLDEQSKGFGAFLLMAHEWADREADQSFLRAVLALRHPGGHRRGPHPGRQPRLGGGEPSRVHRRGGRRDHVGHPAARRGEGEARGCRPGGLTSRAGRGRRRRGVPRLLPVGEPVDRSLNRVPPVAQTRSKPEAARQPGVARGESPMFDRLAIDSPSTAGRMMGPPA